MFLGLLLTPIFAATETYNFITSELPQLYTFSCQDNVSFQYMPLEKYKLIIRTNKEGMKCYRNSLTDYEYYEVPLGLTQKEDYFESEELELEIEPATITCQCTTSKDEFGAISPIVVQNVTPSSGIIVMGIFSIIMVLIDITIVSVQFCTFHHRKSD